MKNLGSGESKLETFISYLLIIGVVVSMVLLVTGLVLFYRSYGQFNILLQDKAMLIQGQNFFGFLWNLTDTGQLAGNAVLFITLGIAVLVLTPYLRVIASAFYFVLRKDYKYAVITVFVLIALTLSLALH